MTAVVLQARLGSARLPGKVLLCLGGKPLIRTVMEALMGVEAGTHVLACPREDLDTFAPLAEAEGFEILGGSAGDVLGRYCDVIRRFSPDRVIRATGDNPFVFADAALAIHGESAGLGADYGGYAGLPYGAGVESVSAEALLRAEREAQLPAEREHVCPYLYNHPEIFGIHRPLAPVRWRDPSARITVDTRDDYDKASRLYTFLGEFRESGKSRGYPGAVVIGAYRSLFGPLPGERGSGFHGGVS